MTQEIIIWSFFTSETDLAAAFRDWREFVAGEGYAVELKDPQTGETVTIRYIEDWEAEHLTIQASAPGALFDRVIGRVIRELSIHSGYLKVSQLPYDADRLFIPKFRQHADS
jgi:hypothetical protein